MWIASLGLAATILPKEPVLGIKRLLLPVSYWRMAEFAYVWKHLQCPPGGRVLDLGSPKELATLVARRLGCHVVSTDILPEEVDTARRYAAARGVLGRDGGEVWAELQDGRSLSYPDASFDAAYSVSVLEHIPDRGDSAAIAELVRVVKPGGVVVVTTPYDRSYRETFIDGPVYERREAGRKFFERHYDERTLAERLWNPAAASVIDVQVWGEGRVRAERLLGRLGPLRVPLSPLEPLLSAVCLREIRPGSDAHPMAVFFTLRKGG